MGQRHARRSRRPTTALDLGDGRRRSRPASSCSSAGRDIDGSSQLRALLADPVGRAGREGGARSRSIFGGARRDGRRRCSTTLVASALVERRRADRRHRGARHPRDRRSRRARRRRSRASCSRSRARSSQRPRARARARQQARRPDRQGRARRHAARRARPTPAPLAIVASPGAAARAAAASASCSRTRPTIVADQRGRIVATVTAAAPLSAAQLERLAAALDDAVRPRRRSSTRSSTPTVVGGLRVQVGDDVIDGTHRIAAHRPPTPARRLTRRTRRHPHQEGTPWQNSRSAPTRSATR